MTCRCGHSANYHDVTLVKGCVACDCKSFAKATRWKVTNQKMPPPFVGGARVVTRRMEDQ